MDELRNRAVCYDIIGVTENWGNNEIYDAELQIPGYHMFRVDRRTTTRGGGVILYVSESIDAVQLDLFDTIEFSDCVFCMLSLSGSKLIVGVCYRSPTSTSENDEALITLINTVAKYVEKQNCIIMGDFNLPNVDFDSFTVQGNSDSFAGRVFDCILDNYWTQHVSDLTRFRANQAPSCLDWVITNDPNILEELNYSVPIGKSDHVCLSWQISVMKRSITDKLKYNYWKADYSAVRDELGSINWQDEFGDKPVNDMWEKFSDIIAACVESHVPLYKHSACKNKTPWMSKDTKKLLKKRNRAWLAYARNKCNRFYAVYKSAEMQ